MSPSVPPPAASDPPPWASMSNTSPGAAPPPPIGGPSAAPPRRRRPLRIFLAGVAVSLIGLGVFLVFLIPTVRDVVISSGDLIGRVDEGEETVVELDEGDYVLVAIGRDLVDADGDHHVPFPPVVITDPADRPLRARAPGYESRISARGEDRIVIADLTVEEAGRYRIQHGAQTSVAPGAEAVALAHKADVPASRILGVIAGALLMGAGGITIVVAGILAILDHRRTPRVAGPGDQGLRTPRS